MSLTCAIHLYLPVCEEALVGRCKQQEAVNGDLDLSGKFGKQLEAGLLFGSMKDIWIVQLPEAMSFFSWPHCVFPLHRAAEKNPTLWKSGLNATGIQVTFKYYKIAKN